MPPKVADSTAGVSVPGQTPRMELARLLVWHTIVWPCATLVLATLLFWVGTPIGPFHLWIGLLASVALSIWAGVDWRASVKAVGALLSVALPAALALEWAYDFSGDGQLYHLPGVLALAQGWNPFLNPRLADWNAAFEQALPIAGTYVQHYAKGAWIVGAAIYRGTGLLEAAKLLNLLFMWAVYIVAAQAGRQAGLGPLLSRAAAVAVAANPIALYQATSFFIDGQVASLYTLLLLLSIEHFRRPDTRLLGQIAAIVVLLAELKFTGLVYAGFVGASLSALAWMNGWRRPILAYLMVGSISLALAVIVAGFQPYVTNVLQHGNPFYPAIGREDGRNIQYKEASPEFLAKNRVEKLVRSVFSESGLGGYPRWKVPFAVQKTELYAFFDAGPRVGGFGPMFGGLLVTALILFALAWPSLPRKARHWAGAIASVITLSTLLNPEAWYARLAPQLWLLPLLLLACTLLSTSNWMRRAAIVAIVAMIGNAVLVGALNWGRTIQKNVEFREQIAILQEATRRDPVQVTFHPLFRFVTEHRLRKYSIPYVAVETADCETPRPFSYPNSMVCLPCGKCEPHR